MSQSLIIEFVNQHSGRGPVEKTDIGEYYARIPLDLDVQYALRWLAENLTDGNRRVNFLTISGTTAVLRMAATGETFLMSFAQAIVDAHHYPLAMIFDNGNEYDLRIIKSAFAAPWTLQMNNNKNVASDISWDVPPIHLHRHHRRIEHITGNHRHIRRI